MYYYPNSPTYPTSPTYPPSIPSSPYLLLPLDSIQLGCNYGMDKNKSIGRPSDPDASAPAKRASLPVVSAPSGPSVPPGPPGPSTVTLAPPPGSQAPPPILGPPRPSGPPRRSSRLTAAQQKIHSEPDACQVSFTCELYAMCCRRLA